MILIQGNKHIQITYFTEKKENDIYLVALNEVRYYFKKAK